MIWIGGLFSTQIVYASFLRFYLIGEEVELSTIPSFLWNSLDDVRLRKFELQFNQLVGFVREHRV